MTRSIHDNFVLSYTVDCEARTLEIRTEYRDQGPPFERTDVRFEGVLGYLLRDGLHGILFDIEEVELDLVLRQHAADFRWGAKYGWPWTGAGKQTPREHVEANNGRVYRIDGAFCFDGFVIAQDMLVKAAPHDSSAATTARDR